MEYCEDKPRIFVGMGASAGGIQACQAVLTSIPADSGAAFIVVLHLDPTRTSHIAEIMQKAARHLTVVQATGAEHMKPDHVYVIAPNSKLSLADGSLEVEILAKNEARSGLVDYLFSSIAEVHGRKAVGVVLSGAGHDGTKGLKAIKEAGGLCIAQDPDSAGTKSMPQSAIDAGVVDAVLLPAAIWPILANFADGDRVSMQQPAQAKQVEVDDPGADDAEPSDGFPRVLHALGQIADVNFDDYKTGTLERRTRRRMGLMQIDNWDEYADRLAKDRDELDALYQDVLIGVTEFFRDAAVWEQLAHEMQGALERRETPGFRAWVPACGTGEEAYTLAILARELVPAGQKSKIQIYATDLNPRALAVARRGIYAAAVLEGVDAGRLENHFNHNDGFHRVDRSIRDCVTFAPHNVLTDPPFSNMDLVSCRNLLIYLKPPAHDRVLKRLHFALREGGMLMLGKAERLGGQGGLFDEIAKHHSLFRARSMPRSERFHIAPRTRERVRDAEPLVAPPISSSAISLPTVAGPDRRIEQFVLRQHTAAFAIVNDNCEIRHLYGRTERYLVPPTGESRQDLLAWTRPGFYIRLRSALRQALESGERVDTQGKIERDGETQRVRCSISPLPAAVSAEGLFLVTFRDIGEAVQRKPDPTDADEPVVRELEQDLHDTRRELQANIEQLETAGEEHRASHEELLSLNEELQSSNEELEASKEELEALNEEMNTINRELEQKNIEFREANSDLNNLFLSTGIPTVFLDADLKIRRFTTATTDVMRLVPSDIGRSIEHVKERFDAGSTVDKCRQVLKTLDTDITEVRTTDGRTFMRHILPYRADDDEIEGISITFADVTAQNQAARKSEVAQLFSEAVVRTVRTPLLVLDAELRIESMNDAFKSLFSTSEEYIGQKLSEIRDRQWNLPRLDVVLATVLVEGSIVNDYKVTSESGTILINARRVTSGEETLHIVLSFEDVTSQLIVKNQNERRTVELKRDADRKDQWIAMLGHELRNPVGAVGNGIELLKIGSLTTDRQQQVVEMMDRQVRHVSNLLDDLLDAARIIAGKLSIDHLAVDMREVSEAAVDSVQQLISKHQFSTTLPKPESVWVSGDKVRLTEVIGNLLSNAAKFTDVGREIRLEVSADDESVIIRVIDSGIGIPDDIKSQIFEVFTQGPRELDRGTRGLGLGLSLVKRLVEAHDGQVCAFSEGDDTGSEFRVVLPRLLHDSKLDTPATDNIESLQSGPRRILIVDDVSDSAEVLAHLLEMQGHATCTADDGPEGIKAASRFKPDVALLDLGLPGMNGYELARRLRDDWPDTTLIAVTGYQKDVAALKEAGFDHHLLKPIDMKQLSVLITSVRVLEQ